MCSHTCRCDRVSRQLQSSISAERSSAADGSTVLRSKRKPVHQHDEILKAAAVELRGSGEGLPAPVCKRLPAPVVEGGFRLPIDVGTGGRRQLVKAQAREAHVPLCPAAPRPATCSRPSSNVHVHNSFRASVKGTARYAMHARKGQKNLRAACARLTCGAAEHDKICHNAAALLLASHHLDANNLVV